MTHEIAPIVSVKNNVVVSNSRDVAAYFGKNHADVVRKVENLQLELPDGGISSFTDTPYVHPQNGQTYRSFDMTRDGFALLAMGFTGKKALTFKLDYIAQYNAMDETLMRRGHFGAFTISPVYRPVHTLNAA